jgi:hypothetical protein
LAGAENSAPARVLGADGKTYPPSRPDPVGQREARAAFLAAEHLAQYEPSPLVQALTGVIEGTVERTRVRAEGEADVSPATAAKKAHRKPLPDTARAAGWELNRAVEAVERITVDDRFVANAQQVATHLRHHLLRSIEALTEVLNQLPETKENGTP